MSGIRCWSCCVGIFVLLSALDDPLLSAGGGSGNTITIVYNNVPGDISAGLQTAGGFSAFIVFDQQKILFDTGGDTTILIENVRALELDTEGLGAVIISHNHWDHAYGLPGVFYLTEKVPKVYVPGSSRDSILQQNPRLNIVPVYEPAEILPRVWSTGELRTSYRDIVLCEQSLILNGDDGLYVITGCAHPGIVEIIERAKEIFPDRPVALVAGGFHLANASEQDVRDISTKLKELGIRNIAPSHCTGDRAMDVFKEEWGDRYLDLYLGHVHKF
jgi:7,8-dihydropterin-6-yl-methyl-4-(beta-D-ribofuranosyl)aminobenzene 5'-phosphate synthase